MAVKFDTLHYAQTLKAGGFTEPQAMASAAALGMVLEESIPVTLGDLATKGELLDTRLALSKDIAQVRDDLSKDIATLRSTDIAGIRVDLADIRVDLADVRGGLRRVEWMLGTLLAAMGAVLVAAGTLLARRFL